ncbi:MAG: hypothetical protein ACREMS_02270 [Gemmatimonadaceae bacterium]
MKPGEHYLVFALRTLSGEIWIDIVDSDLRPGYLFGAPLILFEIVDARLSAEWEASIDDQGELKFAPHSLHEKFFYDRLFEGMPDVVQDFLGIRLRLEDEAGIDSK